jgi:cell division protein ZapB
MNTDTMTRLEQKIDRLVALASSLQRENTALRDRESTLIKERGQLLDKNEQARNRVERMVIRLKALSQEG